VKETPRRSGHQQKIIGERGGRRRRWREKTNNEAHMEGAGGEEKKINKRVRSGKGGDSEKQKERR
jgi:hypothetical protein